MKNSSWQKPFLFLYSTKNIYIYVVNKKTNKTIWKKKIYSFKRRKLFYGLSHSQQITTNKLQATKKKTLLMVTSLSSPIFTNWSSNWLLIELWLFPNGCFRSNQLYFHFFFSFFFFFWFNIFQISGLFSHLKRLFFFCEYHLKLLSSQKKNSFLFGVYSHECKFMLL